MKSPVRNAREKRKKYNDTEKSDKIKEFRKTAIRFIPYTKKF